MPHPLSATLDVLDRADRLTQAAETDAARLRAQVAPYSSHPPAVLDQAVTEHLAAEGRTPAVVSAIDSNQGVPFRWNRPTTVAERDRRLRRRQRWGRLRPRWMSGRALVNLVAGILGGAALNAVGMLGSLGTLPAGQTLFFFVWGAGLTGSVFIFNHLDRRVAEGLSCSRLRPWADDLPCELAEYLKHAPCRAYLRQVLASELPELLGGDVAGLEATRHQAEQTEKAQAYLAMHQRAAAVEQAQAARRAAERPHRMATIAQALERTP